MNVNGHRRNTSPFLIAALLAAALAVAPTAAAHSPGVVLEGKGTATIDGVISPGEWDHAGSIAFDVNLPEGGTTPATLFVMNDDDNVYFAVRFARSFVEPGCSVVFEFDNDHSGGPVAEGDDIVVINSGLFSPVELFDVFRTTAPPCPPEFICSLLDTDAGGSNDGSGAFGNDGSFSVYELSHPLASGDSGHDFDLGPQDTVGFNLLVRLLSFEAIADTTFPDFYGDIVILGGPRFYLRGTGPNSNPPSLFLSTNEPSATTPKYRDSAALNFAGGNAFKAIGSWISAPPPAAATLTAASGLHLRVGLKNSDDIGTAFDVRAKLYRNGILLTSGLARCITGVARNPDDAKSLVIPFESVAPTVFNGSDTLTLQIETRIGTKSDDTRCTGFGYTHSNATGLRLYFDSVGSASRFTPVFEP